MRNKPTLSLSIVVFILLFSCNMEKKIITEKQKIITEKKVIKNILKPKLYEVIAKETFEGKKEKSNVIIRNKEDLKALNKAILLNRQEVELDFLKSNLVVLFMGQKESRGYSIDVAEVTEKEDTICLKVKETLPMEEGEITTMTLTSPYCIVKINSKKEIVIY